MSYRRLKNVSIGQCVHYGMMSSKVIAIASHQKTSWTSRGRAGVGATMGETLGAGWPGSTSRTTLDVPLLRRGGTTNVSREFVWHALSLRRAWALPVDTLFHALRKASGRATQGAVGAEDEP